MPTAGGREFRDLISADNHVSEPFDLWDRIPAHLSDRAPRIEVRDGRSCWVLDNQVLMRLPVPKELRRDTRWEAGDVVPAEAELRRLSEQESLTDMLSSGATDPDSRLADLNADGIWAEVMYPNMLIFVLYRLRHVELQDAMCRLYNDWLLDTFGGNERFVPIAVLPVLDIEKSVAELRRAVGKGYRGVALPVHADECEHPYNHPSYEPLWTAAEEAGVPVHFHAGSGRAQQPARNPGGAVINYVITVGGADDTVCYLTGSGVLERHPDLRVVMVECGAGWLAWVLHAMDDAYREHHFMVKPKLDLLPSEYFRRQGFVTFQNDPVGLHNVAFTGKDCLMWGSDYPHPEGTWPDSSRYLAEQMRGVPQDVQDAVLWDNAARLYGIQRPAVSTQR